LNQGWPTTSSLLRPLQVNFGLVLHRPIESTAFIRTWPSVPAGLRIKGFGRTSTSPSAPSKNATTSGSTRPRPRKTSHEITFSARLRAQVSNPRSRAGRLEVVLGVERGEALAMKRNWNWAVWTGASLVFLGVISYPLFFVRFPALRDFPWANLPMIALGLVLLALGLVRAFRHSDLFRGKIFGSVLAVLALAFSGFFYAEGSLPAIMSAQNSMDEDKPDCQSAVPHRW
jgi:hypothetical protein